jgi:hypothetical protein
MREVEKKDIEKALHQRKATKPLMKIKRGKHFKIN